MAYKAKKQYVPLIKQIVKIAQSYGYNLSRQDNNDMYLRFVKEDIEIFVYYEDLTVVTILNHHRRGRRQLIRRCVDVYLLAEIFETPRIHTGIGYFHKDKNFKKKIKIKPITHKEMSI